MNGPGRVEISKKESIQQSDLFNSAGLHRSRCEPQPAQEKNLERFWKNAGEWNRRVEISKEEFLGSKPSTYGCILTYSRL